MPGILFCWLGPEEIIQLSCDICFCPPLFGAPLAPCPEAPWWWVDPC